MKYRLNIHDVAVKQLESAIWMYAYNYDEVAVHTISAASFELYTKRLKLVDFQANVQRFIKPEKYKEFISIWNKPYNIFKHGEHRHKIVDEFIYDETVVDLLIYFAVEANLVGPEQYRLNCSQVFKAYFIINNPELMSEELREAYLSEAKRVGIDINTLKNKETLRILLDNVGHTFINGTNSPYRDLDRK